MQYEVMTATFEVFLPSPKMDPKSNQAFRPNYQLQEVWGILEHVNDILRITYLDKSRMWEVWQKTNDSVSSTNATKKKCQGELLQLKKDLKDIPTNLNQL